MGEEAVKPNLEVVPPSGGAGGGQDNLGDMGAGAAPPKTPETPPTQKEMADARAAILDAYDVKSVEELNYVLDVAKIGHQSLLAEAEKAKAAERSTQEGQAKQRGRVDFLAKYGDKLVTGPKGQLLVPADVLQETVDDMREDARRIAREESVATVKDSKKKEYEFQQQEVSGYQKWWNDPKNQDLVSGTSLDDDDKPINAKDHVDMLVNSGLFKPQQAAFVVRGKMKDAKKLRELEERIQERGPSSRYEENWTDEIDYKTQPAPIRNAKTKLDEIKKKPEGERGSESYFDMFESSRRWS